MPARRLSACLCMLGALLCAGLGRSMAAERDTPNNPFAAEPAKAAAAGKALFDGACVACHGSGAGGGERAPALNSGRFTHGGSEFEIFQTIQGGVRGTQMPSFAALPADDIWRLVTYIKSLSGGTQTAISVPVVGSAANGETLFFGTAGCADCHEINGRGGLLGPDLSEAGTKPVAAIRLGFKHPPPPVRLGFGLTPRYLDITLKDGRMFSGTVRNEDSFSVALQRPDGSFALLDRSQMRSERAVPEKYAPSDTESRLSPAQLDDLAAYLSRQTKRNFEQTVKVPLVGGLAYERLVQGAAEPHNWLTYWGNYQGTHFSELRQVTRRNVGALQARWAFPMPGNSPLEATPLVVDGIMYVSGPPGDVFAIDARTGLQLWKFHRKQDVVNPYQINPYNRGVAVLGNRVFVGTLDDNLIALDARTGRTLWETRIADTLDGYTLTGAPLALKDRIIVGVSGGESGIRGFLEAYSVVDGHRLWRFNTIPQPGEPGNETWAGESWKTGSGATWLTGSYDSRLNQLYWTVGNPGPDINHLNRAGDNLYTCSVLSLDPETGKLNWHYQFSPHDSHDWDSVEDLVLADKVVNGKLTPVLMHADRNGFFYTLDRSSGRFISATAFVRQTWNKGFEPSGRPIVDPASMSTEAGHKLFPAVGGTNFQPPSYDARSGILYLEFQDAEGYMAIAPAPYERGKSFIGGRFAADHPPLAEAVHGLMALDTSSGRTLWRRPLVRNSLQAGVLATRGGVLFAATAEGNLLASDMKDGQPLWRFQTGGPILAAPMSYAVDGRQYVAIAAGNTLYSFSLPGGSGGVHP